jgi:MFS family permease
MKASSSSSISEASRADAAAVRSKQFPLILPVLFYEYLAIALTKSLIPLMILEAFGEWAYLAIGIMETIKGMAAFLACPFFGKLSDTLGRKPCLLMSITGSTLPVVSLAFSSNMIVFSVMVAISGFFSVTFPLTFAYISDCVEPKDRAPAYGLALATFGLSFTLGPMTGGFLAATYGSTVVFLLSMLLVVVDVGYVMLYLPETAPGVVAAAGTPQERPDPLGGLNDDGQDGELTSNIAAAVTLKSGYVAFFLGTVGSIRAVPGRARDNIQEALSLLPESWNPLDTFLVFRKDDFMSNVAVVVFLYYVSVWGIVSTLMVFVTRNLDFTPVDTGWLLSTYGVSTMLSETVLVRIIVPAIGELASMRVALLAFAIQAYILAFATTAEHIYFSILFSMITNLFYPSISALVSRTVAEDEQGEALGALNGIKAATEGFGPLIFGGLMSLYGDTAHPGAPYLLTGIIALWALLHSLQLPNDPEAAAAKYRSEAQGDEEAAGLLAKENGGGDGHKKKDVYHRNNRSVA